METAEKLQPQQILPVGSDKRNPQENWGGVKNMIEIGSEALSKEEEDSKRTTTGSVKKRISWFIYFFCGMRNTHIYPRRTFLITEQTPLTLPHLPT